MECLAALDPSEPKMSARPLAGLRSAPFRDEMDSLPFFFVVRFAVMDDLRKWFKRKLRQA
jgi:hypothetical protein